MSNKMDNNANALNWFEIPAANIERATKFYENILDVKLVPSEMMGMKMAFFPTDMESGKVGGSLVESQMHEPSAKGSVIYLNANPDLQTVVSKIEAAGGKLEMPKTLINEETGYMAFFTDSEGNKVGLHSTN